MDQSKQPYKSFTDKWQQNKTLAFSETLREGSDIHDWILTRNGFSNPEEILDWFESAQLKVAHSHVDFYGITVRGNNIGCK